MIKTNQPFNSLREPEEPTKIGRVLFALCCGREITRFDAERLVNDHVLNTSVSDLWRRYRILILREWVVVPGFKGNPTRCKRYSLDFSSLENLARSYGALRSLGYVPADPSDGESA